MEKDFDYFVSRETAVGASRGQVRTPVTPEPGGRERFAGRTSPRRLRQSYYEWRSMTAI